MIRWARATTSFNRRSRLVRAGFLARVISTAHRTGSTSCPPSTRILFLRFFPKSGVLSAALILLVLYFALIVYSFRLIERAKDRFGGLLVFGMVAIFFWHVVINVAMVTGVMPVVGVPLPMVSYGGSSLASMMFAIGVMINVSMRRYTF